MDMDWEKLESLPIKEQIEIMFNKISVGLDEGKISWSEAKELIKNKKFQEFAVRIKDEIEYINTLNDRRKTLKK